MPSLRKKLKKRPEYIPSVGEVAVQAIFAIAAMLVVVNYVNWWVE